MPTSFKNLPLFASSVSFPKVPSSGVLPIVVNGITRKTFVSNATNLCGGGTVTGLTGGQNMIHHLRFIAEVASMLGCDLCVNYA